MNKIYFIKPITIVFVLVIFSLTSCGMILSGIKIKANVADTGDIIIEQNFKVRFSLTGGNTNHFSVVTATNATYTYAPGESFTLTATKINLSRSAYSSNFFRSNFFHYRVTPANVLNITGTTTNSITFALTNMDPGSVRITAIATNNLGETNGEHTYTINLQKASYPVAIPPIVYVTTNQTGITGSVLTYKVLRDNRDIYQYITAITNISGSATAGISATGTVMVTNGTATGTSVFEVKLVSPNYLDYVVRIISEIVDPTAGLKEIIVGGIIPADLGSEADPLVKDILGHLGANAGASIKVLYVSESGSGDNSGTDWNNAINGNSTGNNLRATIASISDASATKHYLVLVGGGTYKPTTGTDRNLSFTMKNFTAIIGGFSGTNWNLTGTTTFSGDIGRVNDNTDNAYHVFYHNNILLNNAVLYGVTVTGGNASGGDDPFNKGGGMYNNKTSPKLVNVRFTGNSAGRHGGGMFNDEFSSPVLMRVVFSGNIAANGGGGMFNSYKSSPVLIGVVFTGNRAVHGGGMFNNNHNFSGPLIVNTIFAGNIARSTGNDIVMGLFNSIGETIRIAGSVLGIGTANPKNAIVGSGNSGPLTIRYHSLTNGAVNFGNDATTGGLTYPTIQSSSSAVDIGLFVRRDGGTYYFSKTGTGTSWHTSFTATDELAGTPVDVPLSAMDLTATDIAGQSRRGRPDAGVYEYGP